MALQEEFEKQGIWLFRYRGVLPLIILVIGAALFAYSEIYPDTFFFKESPGEKYFEYFCLLVSLSGLFIRVYTVGHTPDNTSGRNTTKQVADVLNTTGIYSMVRHPLYVGNLLMWLGPAMLTGNLWFVVAFLFFYWLYYERIMFAEEQFLRRKFGDEYLHWAEKTPAFVPRLSAFQKSKMPFNWKKVIKKEKNGLVAVFTLFFAFDIAGAFLGSPTQIDPFLKIMFIATLAWYVLVKILRSQTRLLAENRSH